MKEVARTPAVRKALRAGASGFALENETPTL